MVDAVWRWHEIAGRRFGLNPILMRQQNLQQDRYDMLIESHRLKFMIMDTMEKHDPVMDRGFIRWCAELIDKLEFVQQAFWGLSLDPNFHMFWILPHCSCPKAENEHLWGTCVHMHDPDCPIHSGDPLIGEDPHGSPSDRRFFPIG
jgi:hypothetical protein